MLMGPRSVDAFSAWRVRLACMCGYWELYSHKISHIRLVLAIRLIVYTST
jgi:hypothetical protein